MIENRTVNNNPKRFDKIINGIEGTTILRHFQTRKKEYHLLEHLRKQLDKLMKL